MTGGVLGTPAYMSPEQWRGEKDIDGRSDVYALGCMLYEMLSGQLPYGPDTPAHLMYKHLTEPPPSLYAVKSDLAPEWDGIIACAMAKDRGDRYQKAGDLARAVSRVASGHASPLPEPSSLSKMYEPAPDTLPPGNKPVPGGVEADKRIQSDAPRGLKLTSGPARLRRWAIGLGIGTIVLVCLLAVFGAAQAQASIVPQSTRTPPPTSTPTITLPPDLNSAWLTVTSEFATEFALLTPQATATTGP
jgi:serine/threonine-protein kinase